MGHGAQEEDGAIPLLTQPGLQSSARTPTMGLPEATPLSPVPPKPDAEVASIVQPPSLVPVNLEELNEISGTVGAQSHSNYQQHQVFQKAFHRLLTEAERLYKHELMRIMQQLGVTHLTILSGSTTEDKVAMSVELRGRVSELQAYSKESCDALVKAVTNHDKAFGTALKESLLPVLITSKICEDGVLNRLLSLSQTSEPQFNTSFIPADDVSPTPALASDWSLSSNSTPGCVSPSEGPPPARPMGSPLQRLAPKTEPGSGLAGPPPAKRIKLMADNGKTFAADVSKQFAAIGQGRMVHLPPNGKLPLVPAVKNEPPGYHPPRMPPTHSRVSNHHLIKTEHPEIPVTMSRQIGPHSVVGLAESPDKIPSAFRYLGNSKSYHNDRSSIFSSSNKLPDHGLKLASNGFQIGNNGYTQSAYPSLPSPKVQAQASVPIPHYPSISSSSLLSPPPALPQTTLTPLPTSSFGMGYGRSMSQLSATSSLLPFQSLSGLGLPPPVSAVPQYILPTTALSQQVHMLLAQDPLRGADLLGGRETENMTWQRRIKLESQLQEDMYMGLGSIWPPRYNRHAGRRRKRFKGIRKTASGKWVARIEHNGKQKHLGTFPTLEDAATTYDNALYKILSASRPKKINLRRFNFPDRIRATYGINENGICKKQNDITTVEESGFPEKRREKDNSIVHSVGSRLDSPFAHSTGGLHSTGGHHHSTSPRPKHATTTQVSLLPKLESDIRPTHNHAPPPVYTTAHPAVSQFSRN